MRPVPLLRTWRRNSVNILPGAPSELIDVSPAALVLIIFPIVVGSTTIGWRLRSAGTIPPRQWV